jgi:nicotinamide-nucleotide amidase
MDQTAAKLIARLRRAGFRLATAESCTGGLVAAAITAVPGSSDVLEGGFVTYSNAAKESLLGVPQEFLRAHGAVSEPVARAMAEGAARRLGVNVAVGVTGIAGPDGGTPAKPVGLVHLAAAMPGGLMLHREHRFGEVGRARIRRLSVLEAFELIHALLDERERR